MDKYSKNKISQFILLVICVVLLSISGYNKTRLNNADKINASINSQLINRKEISSQELFNESWNIVKNNYYKKELNKQNWLKWKKKYKNQIKTPDDANIAINTMISSLNDPYSKFLSKEEFIEQNNSFNSKLYGIGVNIASISGKIYIVNVLQGASADSQGVMAGDIILKINDTDVAGQSIYHAAQLIKGDKDASVDLLLLRGNEKINKTIKREEIKIKTVETKNLDENIGYIRISSFIGLDTTKEFVVALNKLKDTKALILDLRGNSGGLFQNAITIANLFLNHGTIVQVVARHNKKNIYKATKDDCIYNKPLVVLIDENSASASEILAAALHDNNRAILAGTRTFGKGLVQKVFSLPNQTGMNITIARYLTPNGIDINEKGVEPDYNITIAHNDFMNNIDSQLNWAQRYLEKEAGK